MCTWGGFVVPCELVPQNNAYNDIQCRIARLLRPDKRPDKRRDKCWPPITERGKQPKLKYGSARFRPRNWQLSGYNDYNLAWINTKTQKLGLGWIRVKIGGMVLLSMTYRYILYIIYISILVLMFTKCCLWR